MERLRKAWPQIRAALVAAHLLAITAVAIPAPVGGGDRRAWKDPSVQEELAAWSSRLGIPEPEFEERLFQLTGSWIRGRDWLLHPAFVYIDWTGCDQPWRMFAGPHRFPARFTIDEQLDGEPADTWHPLFVERSDEFTWKRELLDQERVRSQVFRWAWPDWSFEGQKSCAWLAFRRFEESPRTTAVRCRLFRTQSPTPEEVRNHTEPPGHWEEMRTLHRPISRGVAK